MAKKRNKTGNPHPSGCRSSEAKVEVVVFEDPLKKRGKKAAGKSDGSESSAGHSFDWHKARHDVFRFGIRGLAEKEQTHAKVSLAVKLGARPAPNKCINFKELLKQRKTQREEEKVKQLESGNDRYTLKPLVARKKKLTKKQKGGE